jgi:maltooligosyltrehalose synthase
VTAFRATYRLQLGTDLDFAAARALLPYLSDLGISHLYLSPIWQAREGSTHGYDVVDPAAISRELGGEEGLRALAAFPARAGDRADPRRRAQPHGDRRRQRVLGRCGAARAVLRR